MTQPILNGTPLPAPTSSRQEIILEKGEHTTVNNRTVWDITSRKYKYILTWNFINCADYNALETIVNTIATPTFTWNKYTESSSVSVLSKLSARSPITPGNPTTDYYSNITLELLETSSRL